MTIQSLKKPDRYAQPAERIDYRKLALPKSVPVADRRFRDSLRSKGCQVHSERPDKHPKCGPVIKGRVVHDFCHVPAKRGMGQKAADVGNGIRMCHDLHVEQHAIGWPAFQRKYGIDACEIAKRNADEYLKRKPSVK